MDDKGETHEHLRLPNLCESDLTLAKEIQEAFESGDDVNVRHFPIWIFYPSVSTIYRNM